MKTILASLFAVLAFSSAAHASEIASLDCLASNGVIFKGESSEDAPLKVTSSWGLVKKVFSADLSTSETDDKLTVKLSAKDSPTYVLSLDAPKAQEVAEDGTTTLSGTLLQLSDVRGFEPAIVGYVRCDLRIR